MKKIVLLFLLVHLATGVLANDLPEHIVSHLQQIASQHGLPDGSLLTRTLVTETQLQVNGGSLNKVRLEFTDGQSMTVRIRINAAGMPIQTDSIKPSW